MLYPILTFFYTFFYFLLQRGTCAVCLLLLLTGACAKSQPVLTIGEKGTEVALFSRYDYLTDTGDAYLPDNILQQPFLPGGGKVPVYAVGTHRVWLRFRLRNETAAETLFFDLRYTELSHVTLYKVSGDRLVETGTGGNALPDHSPYPVPDFIVPLTQAPHSVETYLLLINSTHPIVAPAYVCTQTGLYRSVLQQHSLTLTFIGIVCVMLIYNLCLYFSVKDTDYLIYCIYTGIALLAQCTVSGYGYKYLWPGQPWLNQYAMLWLSVFSIVAGIFFSRHFLQARRYSYRLNRLLLAMAGVFAVCLATSALHYWDNSYQMLNALSLLTCALIVTTAVRIARKGYRPAFLYLFAWGTLIISVAMVALRNMGVLPYNNLTTYGTYGGMVVETFLISVALADKINILRREKSVLIVQQNEMLEEKIAERTRELEDTLLALKDTQLTLVESEKTASLNVLAAGMAHELNNANNFVKSNVKPLQMNLKELTELTKRYRHMRLLPALRNLPEVMELEEYEEGVQPDYLTEETLALLAGIEEGALRTAYIIRSLQTFSRLDESEMKTADINEGIESTLALLASTVPDYITIERHLAARGKIDCYPAKLNQVFANLLSNCVDAIKSKPEKGEERIVITSATVDDTLVVSFEDTGTGMPENVKQKLFQPFFTTKEPGKGTGLGMAVAFKIIEQHRGKITVVSRPGAGSKIAITLPASRTNG